MGLVVESLPVPLSVDAHGVIRVGQTRVTLDTVVNAFLLGSTPEGIVDQYPSLRLADVYTTISYYLTHREQIDNFLLEQARRAEEIRAALPHQEDWADFRARLLARQSRPTPRR